MTRAPETVLREITAALTRNDEWLDEWLAGSFVQFKRIRENGVTQVWGIWGTASGLPGGGPALGYVKWFGRWRAYCFFAEPNTVFEQTCLREIAHFVETLTRLHRETRKKQRGNSAPQE